MYRWHEYLVHQEAYIWEPFDTLHYASIYRGLWFQNEVKSKKPEIKEK